MRKFVFLLVCVFIVGCKNPDGKNYTGKNANEPGGSKPKLEFTEEIHNFGQLNAGETVVYDFVFTNSGKGVLEIKNIETGCTCLQVIMQERIVKPGKKGVLKAILNTSGLYGEQFHAFRIITASDEIRVDLAVTAEVINKNIQFNN